MPRSTICLPDDFYSRILYLDEPTSGVSIYLKGLTLRTPFTDRSSLSDPQLDSTAAKEVIASVGSLAKKEGIMVIASIHQPSFATLNEFTSLVLLSQGSLCYKGKVDDLEPFLLEIGVGSAPFVSSAPPPICTSFVFAHVACHPDRYPQPTPQCSSSIQILTPTLRASYCRWTLFSSSRRISPIGKTTSEKCPHLNRTQLRI